MPSGSPVDHRDGRDEPPEDADGGHGDKIEIVVITTAEDLDKSYNVNEPLRPVYEQALTLVGGHGQSDQFALEYDGGPMTDLDRRLGDYAQELGWGSRVELELVPKPVVV